METVAESGKGGVESRKYAPDSAWVWRMSRLTRDGTAEPNSRDQTLRRERGTGKILFSCSADHEQDWQPYPVDAQSAKTDDHKHTHTHTHEWVYDQQPTVGATRNRRKYGVQHYISYPILVYMIAPSRKTRLSLSNTKNRLEIGQNMDQISPKFGRRTNCCSCCCKEGAWSLNDNATKNVAVVFIFYCCCCGPFLRKRYFECTTSAYFRFSCANGILNVQLLPIFASSLLFL